MTSFGQTLQSFRKTANMAQTELAARSHTPIDSLRNWEQGRSLPRVDAAARLAKALGVSLDDLTGGLAEVPPDEAEEESKRPRGRPKKGK